LKSKKVKPERTKLRRKDSKKSYKGKNGNGNLCGEDLGEGTHYEGGGIRKKHSCGGQMAILLKQQD